MFPQRKFRIAKECHFKESFLTYINSNHSISQFDSLQPFINELSQYRNLIGYLNGNEKDENKILKDITNSEIYISTLNFLMSKIDQNLKINFSWRESCNDQETNSFNFHYEICSVLFNIAISKCILGFNSNHSKNVENLKKSVKFYKEAAGTFEEIRSLVNEHLKKENFADFSENYLKCCKDFCIAEAQMILCKFSEIKCLNFEIQAKLNYGVFVLLNRCMSYSLSSFKADKTIVQYEREFFCAKAFYFKKKSFENEFKNYGKNLSEMICLLTEAIKKAYENAKKEHSANMIALMDALFVGGLGTAGAYMLLGVEWTTNNIICLILMIVAIWLGAMLGFDKIKQTISQLAAITPAQVPTKEEEKKEEE